MSRFLLLTCGESSKKLPVSNDLTIQYIRESVRTRFGFEENFMLKYFDSDVLEYIDLDDEENINTEERIIKIKVLIVSQQPTRNEDPNKDLLQETQSQPAYPRIDHVDNHSQLVHCTSTQQMDMTER